MALINNINTQNTFDQWVTTTQQLVSTVNSFTDGPAINSNTSLDITGTGSKLNVRNSGAINTLYANTANIANISFAGNSMTIPGNVARMNVTTDLAVGGNTSISANVNIGGNVAISQNVGISGNLVISYNMNVASNITVNNITAFGRANATNVTVSGAINTAFLEYTTANGQTLAVTGTATMNRAAGNVLSQIEEISIALSLVLG
jgi:hypothetical protein